MLRIGSAVNGSELAALNSVQRAFSSLSETSLQLATLQRVNRGSDDPAALARIDGLQGDLLELQTSGNEDGARDAEGIALTSALSEIRDADVADLASRLVRDRILAQVAVAAVGIAAHNRRLTLGLLGEWSA